VPRTNDRKLTLSLENLETRNLQSGVSAPTGAVFVSHIIAVPPSAMIAPTAGHVPTDVACHAYHNVTAFYGL
jgi:hypothetical protein